VAFDPYQILGVGHDATAEEIRKAYRTLARRYHPDVNKDRDAESVFKDVAQAFAILSSDEKRSRFDEFGEASLRLDFDPEKARAARRRADEVPEEFIFEGTGPFPPDPGLGREPLDDGLRPQDSLASVEVDLGLALRGGEVQVTSPLSGGLIRLDLPPGIDSGYRVRLPGRGRPGRRGSGPGDLYVEVSVLPHPFFRRDGSDLHLELPITVPEAIRGASVDIPTLDGWIRIPVPPETRGGEQLRLKGRGVEDEGGSRGDLYIHLCLRLPERIADAGRTLERLVHLYAAPVREGLDL
jgi:curved DNA-binding protein